ncbi:MAG: beta-hexosaminidase, partial [Calditrichaeota bacterium]
MKMNIFIAVMVFAYPLLFCGEASMTLHLMPKPEQLVWEQGQYRLQENFTISVSGSSPRLYDAATRTLRRLSGRTGLFFPQDVVSPALSPEASCMIKAERIGKLQLNEDESYSLTINPQAILLAANTDIGALRGLETLLQLLACDDNGYFFPAVSIQDKPRFPWRGLMIDVARHWQPMEVIKRNLDGMAAVKMNVLHLHLTEDQGFRIECKAFPKLHEMGSDGDYFTHEQIREIIDY